MRIDTIVVGDYQTNCYILSIDNKSIIIDPGDESDIIMKMISDNKLLAILVTHTHDDHIGAIPDISDKQHKIQIKFFILALKHLATSPGIIIR